MFGSVIFLGMVRETSPGRINPVGSLANPHRVANPAVIATDVNSAFDSFRQTVPEERVQQFVKPYAVFSRGGPLSAWLVSWLMISQRLHPVGTLAIALRELATGPARNFVRWKDADPSKVLSPNTSAYSQARSRLPLKVAEEVADLIFTDLSQPTEPVPQLGLPMYLLDGSSILLSHNAELAQAYPPAENRFGTSHWCVVRVLVAHDVMTGLAVRPHWGPMYGPQAVSEQGLAKELLERLPAGSVALGDRNFGVFSVAYDCQQTQHPCLLRLTQLRAAKLNQGVVPHAGTDKAVSWEPSRWDLKNHPEIPAAALVAGRLIAIRVPGQREKLFFFTTLQVGSAEQILEVYGYRWRIETDLRSLKSEVRLHMIHAQSADMVAKELVLGVAAYNLTRGAMQSAATVLGLQPRELSFSLAQDTLNAFLPALARAGSEAERQQLLQEMLRFFRYSRLGKRKRPTYSREVWGQPNTYPRRKAEQRRTVRKRTGVETTTKDTPAKRTKKNG
jgi:hypothetical protein